MESLRMRYLIVGQSSADTVHRLGQTLEASSRVGTAQEDLALWLGRVEKELASWDSQHGGQEPPVSSSDREKVREMGALGTDPGDRPPLSPSRSQGRVWRGAGMGCAGQRGCPALTKCAGGSALGAPPVHSQQLPSLLQFEQILGSELAHLEGLSERLEAVSQVQLDAQALRSQLSDQKVGRSSCSGPPCALLVPSPGLGAGCCSPTEGRRCWAGGRPAPGVWHVQPCRAAMRHPPACVLQLLSAEILHHRGLAERLLGVADPLLRSCPEPLQQRLQVSGRSGAVPGGTGGMRPAVPCPHAGSGHPASCVSLQPSVQALRERAEQLFVRSGACAVQLEHAQSLLAQFAEAHAELLPWLEETQAVGVQLSPNAISYEAFKEQQALLQVRDGEGQRQGRALAPRGSVVGRALGLSPGRGRQQALVAEHRGDVGRAAHGAGAEALSPAGRGEGQGEGSRAAGSSAAHMEQSRGAGAVAALGWAWPRAPRPVAPHAPMASPPPPVPAGGDRGAPAPDGEAAARLRAAGGAEPGAGRPVPAALAGGGGAILPRPRACAPGGRCAGGCAAAVQPGTAGTGAGSPRASLR